MVTYTFAHADKDFIYELTKVGRVSVTSSQVTIYPGREGFRISNAFPDGMQLPDNWSIEYIGSTNDGSPSITFKVDRLPESPTE